MLNKVIISGGGTGGHIFPAVAIANEIKRRYPNCEILFVGALGKMEMEKIPEAGYPIVGLPIRGLQRTISLSNLNLPFLIIKSLWKAFNLIREFKPEVVIGVGGYASATTLYVASKLRIPCLVQEQNSYAGLTNKLLANKAMKFCVAYENMEQFFPKEKIVITGNPVRKVILLVEQKNQEEEKANLGFDKKQPLVLAVGGSLGALTINNTMQSGLQQLADNGIQLLWQTGKNFTPNTEGFLQTKALSFITDMAAAYAAADIVVSRAGALSISELCVTGKPVILVPSPNVAEDHQTKNAKALVKNEAAIMIADKDANQFLISSMIALLKNEENKNKLSLAIKKMASPNAVDLIVNQIELLKQ